jgi:hypothetical protein
MFDLRHGLIDKVMDGWTEWIAASKFRSRTYNCTRWATDKLVIVRSSVIEPNPRQCQEMTQASSS